jgi:hypothetical protein
VINATEPHRVSSVAVFAFLWAIMIPDCSKGSVVTGVVTTFRPGELIAVANETTAPQGIQILLRNHTHFVGDDGQITAGTSVTVEYRYIGERLPVADEVRILSKR